MIGGKDTKERKTDVLEKQGRGARVKEVAFIYGWCGHNFALSFYDTEQKLSVPKPYEASKVMKIDRDDQIVNLKMRYVHTTSYEFDSNIVGCVIRTRKGKVETWEGYKYVNHGQTYYEIDLSQSQIVGITGSKSDYATLDVLANLSL
eukprot:CAMPEP_0176349822 /NCGR_PEP_ID=MMETSP0126-20121128/8981_1 /TAXON_ID=141414 ORGANISM="Strombidinopsis acuminatum, Strain SPMC142" /NCGR_SAMPLE_ID=MMETSP0126 /ASSEMBLY_ACC=CAM_ASM_000229 /LENGTH=146 /DNA_ID=CAMNT_0017699461 /DNA_START=191 /DNA_END=631 /DNA_ORIENTATION=+